jgi:hypothetical protein
MKGLWTRHDTELQLFLPWHLREKWIPSWWWVNINEGLKNAMKCNALGEDLLYSWNSSWFFAFDILDQVYRCDVICMAAMLCHGCKSNTFSCCSVSTGYWLDMRGRSVWLECPYWISNPEASLHFFNIKGHQSWSLSETTFSGVSFYLKMF